MHAGRTSGKTRGKEVSLDSCVAVLFMLVAATSTIPGCTYMYIPRCTYMYARFEHKALVNYVVNNH